MNAPLASTVCFVSDFLTTTLPTWFTAIGTVGLAAFAYWQIKRASDETRALRIEASQARLKAQAERIVAWCEPTQLQLVDFKDDNQAYLPGIKVGTARVRNRSAEPITQISIRWHDPRPDHPILDSRYIQQVAPEQDITHQTPLSLRKHPQVLPISLTFTDAHGISWERTLTGELKESGVGGRLAPCPASVGSFPDHDSRFGRCGLDGS